MGRAATAERREELSLLSAVLDGDRRAGRSFFQRYNSTVEMSVRKVLRRAARRATEDDVRDLVGEIWVSLLDDDKRPLRRFDPRRDVRVTTWIGLLARNKAIDRLRCTHNFTVSLDDVSELAEPPSLRPLPVEEMEARERRELARAALAQLRPADRIFMEKWYIEEREPEELARHFRISVGTVYSRRFKIQEKLARAISRASKRRARRVILARRTVN